MGLRFVRIIILLVLFGNELLFAQEKKLSTQQESDIQKYKTFINQYQKANNKVKVAEYLNKIAYIYWENGLYAEALNFFMRSLEINKEQEAQLIFERQLLEIQAALQGEQDKKLRFERTVRQILMGAMIVISALALIIYWLYRQVKYKDKRLLESEEKFRKLFEDSEDVLLIFDNSKIIDCNHACWKFLGFSGKEQLIDEGLDALLPDMQPDQSNSLQKTTAMIDKAYQVGYSRYELVVKNLNNILTYVDVSHTAINILGKKVIYSIWRDIDRQKKAENEINSYKEHLEELVKTRTADLEKAKIKAEESDKLKTVFLSNMSHEIKTPLNAIIGISKIMLKDDSSLNDKNKESLKVIYESGHRLFRLLDDILQYSEILAGNAALTISNIQTNALRQQIQHIATDAIGDKPLSFLLSVDPDFPGSFKSDSHKLLEILKNLVDNAAKFTDKGMINLSLTKDNNHAIFHVSDTGKGIDKVYIPQVFEVFKQVDDSASRKHNGTGLGLAICKGFIDLLGGSISVDSDINKGTCVRFEIPI